MTEKKRAGDGLRPESRRIRSSAKDKVTPDVPKSLPAMPSDLPKNRLGLAKWLLQAGASADGSRHRKSLLAGTVRHGHRPDRRRLRRHRRTANASRTARLAGRRVPRKRLGREAVLQDAGHVGDVPTGRDRDGREEGKGPAQSLDQSRPTLSAWMPRWSAITPWRRAGCSSRRSAVRA